MLQALRRWRWAVAIGVVLALALAYALWPAATVVDLGTVSRGPMAVGITDIGKTREDELYVVSAPVTGFASRITLEAGDPVRKGQVITRIAAQPTAPLDRRTQETLGSDLASARAARASAAAAFAQATRDLARAESLDREGFIPRAQLETTRTRVATDRATLDQARAEEQRILAALGSAGRTGRGAPVAVTAPASGAMLLVPNKSEGMVAQGAPLATIGDPAKIEVVVELLSRDAVQVQPGDRVEITQWGGAAPLIGFVKRIEPFGWLKVSALGIEEQRVNVIVGFDPRNARAAARLGHGYQLDATIILWSRQDVLRVPIGALFRADDGTWRIFVDDRGRARERAVRIGHVNDDYAEVLAGVRQGETVVLNPASTLAAGDRITGR
ncbi:MAG: efflux RND transporter periplasmic adaptor subunit [Sphingomonas sp.]